MKIRRARDRDAAELTSLVLAAKAHWGYPPDWLESWRPELALSPTFIATHEVHLLEAAGQALACYSLVGRSGPDSGHEPGLWLEHLFVRPDRLRAGLGTSLLRHARQRAAELGADRLLVLSDPHAAGFYARNGGRLLRLADSSIPGRRLPVYALSTRPA